MPNNTKISDLDLASQLNEADLLLLSQQESESESETENFDSKKTTVGNLAEKVATGVQFSGLQTDSKTITGAINEAAAVGKVSDGYTSDSFDSEDYPDFYSGSPCWIDSGETADDHIVYKSDAGTYENYLGDSLCTYTVEGYNDVTFYIKQDAEDTDIAYVVLGNGRPINLDNRDFARSYQGEPSNTFYSYTFNGLGGAHREFQVLYHLITPTPPASSTATIDLNNGAWVDSGEEVSGHTVYKSDAGSYHVDYGESKCVITINGVTSFSVYCKPSTYWRSNYVYIGNLDTPIDTSSESGYKERFSGQADNYSTVNFTNIDGNEHTIEILYKKDSFYEDNDDRGYIFFTINGNVNTSRGYVYMVPGEPTTPQGEVFNNYENNYAFGWNSHAEGNNTRAFANKSHAEGDGTRANGESSHAEGYETKTFGSYSHAEGWRTSAISQYSHAEGEGNIATGGDGAHAEGSETTANGEGAHAEGCYTLAEGVGAHAEGDGGSNSNQINIARGYGAHAEGMSTQALNWAAHAEGRDTIAKYSYSHAEGYHTLSSQEASHAEGYYTTASGYKSHAEGSNTTASNEAAHAEGYYTVASASYSHAEGKYTDATGEGSHAEGLGTNNTHNIASGDGSHAEGGVTNATGNFSHAEGYSNTASGIGAHAEGMPNGGGPNIASGDGSHAEGSGSKASGHYSHAEGAQSKAIGQESHAEGGGTYAYGDRAHSEGAGTRAYGSKSHAEGAGTETFGVFSHIEGAGSVILGSYGHMEGAGNASTGSAFNTHTEGGGNFNYSVQGHVEGSGNTISGEESHGEGAGNQVHGTKNHGEGGGNAVYGVGSHVEGKHNSIAGFAVHAEGSDNLIGSLTSISQFDYGIDYNVGDIVGPNADYVNFGESSSQYLYRCITAPGKIQEGNGVEFVTTSSWSSSTDYPANSVVYFWAQKGCGYYYCSSAISAQDVPPPVDGSGWTRIGTLLSPFKSGTYSGYYLIRADQELSSGISVAKVASDTSIQAMWEAIPTPHSSHVEGLGNISTGDYQHVQGKYNTADSNKAFIIGNGTKDSNNVITRSNALTVDWSGNMVLAGDITVGAINGTISGLAARIPAAPTTDGTYILSVTVSDGVPTYSWVATSN